jgi:predicted transcriptional regulator
MKKTTRIEKLLTEVEFELMSILWRLGEGSVADVIGQLPENRELAYTSVSTILRILEQKTILSIRKEGRGHIYIPTLRKSEYEAKAVKDVVERVFDGTPAALVRQLLDSGDVTDKELVEIRKLVTEFGSKQ